MGGSGGVLGQSEYFTGEEVGMGVRRLVRKWSQYGYHPVTEVDTFIDRCIGDNDGSGSEARSGDRRHLRWRLAPLPGWLVSVKPHLGSGPRDSSDGFIGLMVDVQSGHILQQD